MAATFYAFLDIGPGWPRGWIGVQFETPSGEPVSLKGTDDGRLSAAFRGNTELTQAIEVVSRGFVGLCITADDAGRVAVYAGDFAHPLTDSTLVRVLQPNTPPERPRSYQAPDARAKCAAWIAHRSARYAPAPAPPGRRLRSADEDLEKLAESGGLLREAAVAVRAGKAAHLNIIKAELRALIVEKPGPNWNPLLFRVAARQDLPLPVYAVPGPPAPPATPELDMATPPRTLASFSTDEVFDLQEWLSWKLGQVGGLEVTGTDFVLRLGSADGGGHVDPSIPTWFDRLAAVKSEDQTLLALPLTELADTVAELAEWIGAEARKQG